MRKEKLSWQEFTRMLVAQGNGWRPCICIQGGGAKGAWEAGLLSGLLGSFKTQNPVAIWGTSAGAINAYWAATLPDGSAPDRLLSLWCTLSHRIVTAVAHAPAAVCTEIRASGRVLSIDATDAGQNVRSAKRWTGLAQSFTNVSYIALPTSYGVPQAARCGQDWIALQPVGEWRGKLSSIITEVFGNTRPTVERIGDGIVYARLPTFNSANYRGISRSGWANREPSDRVLIVDLRNNDGGGMDYGLDVLNGWIDPSRMVPFGSIGTQINSSCLYPALKWNYPDPGGKAERQPLLDRMAQQYPTGCPRGVDVTQSKWTYLTHHFAPKPRDMRIIALINSSCASDCELMTEELASLPETLVVGVNTYGVCQMIQPGYSVLPHTGLHYRIAMGRSDPYGDNRSVDGYGLDVDIVLPDVDNLGRGSMRELAAIVARP